MSVNSYWNRHLAQRVSRRRALATAGATAFGAALLAACGGEQTGVEGDKSGFLSPPEDSTKQAVSGGIFVSDIAEARSIDPLTNNATTAFPHLLPVYSLLVKWGFRNDGKQPGFGDISGDAAESWETSPDGMQLTFRLRANHKFDPRPPTSGRAMTAADVKWSWERMESASAFFPEVAASKGAGGSVQSVSFPDARTVVLKLAFPYISLLDLFAFGRLWISPVEAMDKFDPRNEARGSGPYFLEKWTPSVGFEYRKNPDWYDKTFLDGFSYKILSEYATRLAQFEAGEFWTTGVEPRDILRLKRDRPELVMRRNFMNGGPNGHYWAFSQLPDSPFRDVRLRRAASMLIDRDLFIDTEEELEVFRSAGLPVDVFWHTHMAAQGATWMDPKGKELGEGAKYFQYNPSEAKKLIAAAGYDQNKARLDFWSRNTDTIAAPSSDVMAQMLSEGFNLDHQVLISNTSWRQKCQEFEPAGTAFNGLCYATTSAFNDESWYSSIYTPGGKFKFSSAPIPGVTDVVEKIRVETDINRQMETMKQLQRQLASEMLNLPVPGFALGYTLNQPWLKNYNVFTWGGPTERFSSTRNFTRLWYDPSQKKA